MEMKKTLKIVTGTNQNVRGNSMISPGSCVPGKKLHQEHMDINRNNLKRQRHSPKWSKLVIWEKIPAGT